MATAMKVRGFAGAVIDASVRDTPQIRRIQFPVFSRGIAPSTTINHYRVAGVNVPVTCAGARVNPGDFIRRTKTESSWCRRPTRRRHPEEGSGTRRHGAPHAALHRKVQVDQGSGRALRPHLGEPRCDCLGVSAPVPPAILSPVPRSDCNESLSVRSRQAGGLTCRGRVGRGRRTFLRQLNVVESIRWATPIRAGPTAASRSIVGRYSRSSPRRFQRCGYPERRRCWSSC